MKKLMVLATLTAALTGCVVAPDAHSQPRHYDRPYSGYPTYYHHIPRHKGPPPQLSRRHPPVTHYRHKQHQLPTPRSQHDQRWYKAHERH